MFEISVKIVVRDYKIINNVLYEAIGVFLVSSTEKRGKYADIVKQQL